MRNGTLYMQFAELLHEMPEAEDALRAWRQQQARTLIRKRLEERRRRAVDELCQQLRAARAGKPDSIIE